MNSVLQTVFLSGLSLCALLAGPGCQNESGTGIIPPAAYANIAERLRSDGLRNEQAFALLTDLTRAAGPRLSGSPAAAAAVEHMRRVMESLGFETWLEPTMVQHWVRGEEEAAIVGSSGKGDFPLTISTLGGSVPTPASGLTAPVIEVDSFEELERRGPAVKGTIVFFNHPMDRTRIETFAAYGEAARYRAAGASMAAGRGAAAVLVRSVTPRIDDYPHTGMLD
ncbi:MAG: zinc-binding metallopeptidase family protein, partial [Candidatus Aminicenantales bacterium]